MSRASVLAQNDQKVQDWVLAFMERAFGATAAQFDKGDTLTTAAFVQRALGNFSDYLELSVNTVLTPADVGKVIKASVVDVTLPALASVPNGAAVMIRTGQGGRLLVQGGDQLFSQVGVLPTPYAVVQPQVFHIIKVGNAWQILSGDGALPSSALFASLLSANGYQKYPSGLIEQWGTVSVADNSEQTVLLPTVFPNAILGVSASVAISAIAGASEFATAGARKAGSSLNSILVNANTGPTTGVIQTVTWRAWGN
ncbi:hypothetical protein C1893_23500 [Pseudomonas sp. MPR-ANC1]|uniref:gp53-like domain-containing protein n=1 Tax=Pseudomonas sp. MPR-ANC1 TaxID=2075548 RepID=UPI000CD078DE|nr:hypothetical protein [Pseudomonas sp. MPR-ANC1]POA45621.1 hypothetical protein C1893_23500 [Pseudomonas sp. MPR-ANC1]